MNPAVASGGGLFVPQNLKEKHMIRTAQTNSTDAGASSPGLASAQDEAQL